MLRALVCIRAQASRVSLLCILWLPDLSFLWLQLPKGPQHSRHKLSEVEVALSLLPQYFLSQWPLNPRCYVLDPSSPCFPSLSYSWQISPDCISTPVIPLKSPYGFLSPLLSSRLVPSSLWSSGGAGLLFFPPQRGSSTFKHRIPSTFRNFCCCNPCHSFLPNSYTPFF